MSCDFVRTKSLLTLEGADKPMLGQFSRGVSYIGLTDPDIVVETSAP